MVDGLVFSADYQYIRTDNHPYADNGTPSYSGGFIFGTSIFSFKKNFHLYTIDVGLGRPQFIEPNPTSIYYSMTLADGSTVQGSSLASNTFTRLNFDTQVRSISFGRATFGYISLDNVVYEPGEAVPEPASWAMLVAGFGLVGCSLRLGRMIGRQRGAPHAARW